MQSYISRKNISIMITSSCKVDCYDFSIEVHCAESARSSGAH